MRVDQLSALPEGQERQFHKKEEEWLTLAISEGGDEHLIHDLEGNQRVEEKRASLPLDPGVRVSSCRGLEEKGGDCQKEHRA